MGFQIKPQILYLNARIASQVGGYGEKRENVGEVRSNENNPPAEVLKSTVVGKHTSIITGLLVIYQLQVCIHIKW